VPNIRFGQIETLRVSSWTSAFAMRTPKAVSPMSARPSLEQNVGFRRIPARKRTVAKPPNAEIQTEIQPKIEFPKARKLNSASYFAAARVPAAAPNYFGRAPFVDFRANPGLAGLS